MSELIVRMKDVNGIYRKEERWGDTISYSHTAIICGAEIKISRCQYEELKKRLESIKAVTLPHTLL